jgi:hypothetical protein
MRAAFLCAILLYGCPGEPSRQADEPVPIEPSAGDDAPIEPAEPELTAYVVHSTSGEHRAPLEAAGEHRAVTLVGPGGACLGQLTDDVTEAGATVEGCDLDGPAWWAFPGEVDANVTLPEALAAPSLESAADYLARFGATGFGFRLESPPGDDLCPGSPTTIVFLHGDATTEGAAAFDEARVVGSTTVDAPVTRGASEGVLGLLQIDGLYLAALAYGGDERRLVTLEGDSLAEGTLLEAEPCGCCNGEE